MPHIVGVRFRPAGKIYYFDPGGLELEVGAPVIVPTDRGADMATVALPPREVVENNNRPLKPLTRSATEDDIASMRRWEALQPEAFEQVFRRAQARGLPLKPTEVLFSFDGRRMLVGYIAEAPMDLGQLARELESFYDTRVEFQYVGARDAARQTGDIGLCGRQLCCQSFLTEFPPVAIKMAKNQDLPLNPAKISGVCGRLLCCLAYENDFYTDVRGKLPKPGTRVSTPRGTGVARRGNILRESVAVEFEDGELVDIALDALAPAER